MNSDNPVNIGLFVTTNGAKSVSASCGWHLPCDGLDRPKYKPVRVAQKTRAEDDRVSVPEVGQPLFGRGFAARVERVRVLVRHAGLCEIDRTRNPDVSAVVPQRGDGKLTET